MKSLIVYSSKSGNTKVLAETLRDILPGENTFTTVDENPDTHGYDLICVGFWFQAGKPDPQSATFLSTCVPGKVFLFATHGATNNSDHAANGMAIAKTLATSSEVVGFFHCQGEVNPKLIEKAKTMNPPPPWINDAPLANGHPDTNDIDSLKKEFEGILTKIRLT